MGKFSEIQWTNATWNPWQGCKKVSTGCKNCYMYRAKKRFGQDPSIISRSKTTFQSPLKWNSPKLIFTCSWSDWFLEEADQWRSEGWDIIRKTPYHTYQILTKRPERIKDNLPPDWKEGWENVWLGVSIESEEYICRIKLIKEIPVFIRFISFEPLLSSITIDNLEKIDWVITGGESGPKARKTDINWFREIRDNCIKYNIPYFHKQNGGTKKIEGAWGGRTLDGVIWEQFPNIYKK